MAAMASSQPGEIACPPPDRHARKPRLVAPRGSCDCHVHVLPSLERYPYQANRAYTPPDATLDDLFAMHAVLGVERAVLVQASVHGTDNRAILDALATAPKRLRAVVTVTDAITDAELAAFHARGVRGIRVNLVDRGGMPFSSLAALGRMADRIKDMGWHIELLAHVESVPDFRELVTTLSVPVSVGHMGYTHASAAVQHSGYQDFLALLRDGHCWVKLTGPYRISTETRLPFADIVPFAHAVIAAAPERVLWGSDWPHVMCRTAMPNDGDLFDLLASWAPDARTRGGILVDNPARLYDFG